MKVITDNIFFEEFFKNPMPICLFGTSGVIHYYIGYIEFLVKKYYTKIFGRYGRIKE